MKNWKRMNNMRLNEQSKAVVCGNIELMKYCRRVGISSKKLKECNIEKVTECSVEEFRNAYVFVLSKENAPKSKCILPLDIDLYMQPDIVLIMRVLDDCSISFKTTQFTGRIYGDSSN